jgi:long-chain acyl-CoA synthetase
MSLRIPNPAEYIDPEQVENLPSLFTERVSRTPDRIAYRYLDTASNAWVELTWAEVGRQVARWRTAIAGEGLQAGDRVAVMLRNRPEWVFFDQAALGQGLVDVPLYANDRAENAAYVLRNSGARLLLIDDLTQWVKLRTLLQALPSVQRIVVVDGVGATAEDSRVLALSSWLTQTKDRVPATAVSRRGDLATIVYTSGTTGPPKGVMLSHGNLLWNAHAVLQRFPVFSDDVFLSVLPLSHTFERSSGYYLPMMGGVAVTYARSPQTVADDIRHTRPTIMLTVPRIFERIYDKIAAGLDEQPLLKYLFELTVRVGWSRFLHDQGRDRWRPSLLAWPLLDRLLAHSVRKKIGWDRARILKGYGLTEASPVVSANSLTDNEPSSVGTLLAEVQVHIGTDAELLVKSPGVMLGYWRVADDVPSPIDHDGWLHTGDQATLRDRHLFITGRIKEIIVLANGEKVAPESVEAAIAMDPLFDQALVSGEGCAYLSAVTVVNPEQWQKLTLELRLDPHDPTSLIDHRVKQLALERIESHLNTFPGYIRVRMVTLTLTPWTVEEGLVTPTLKLRRTQLMAKFQATSNDPVQHPDGS